MEEKNPLKIKRIKNVSSATTNYMVGSRIERYLARLEKEVATMESIVEKEKEFLPEKIEQAIRSIIREEFKSRRFNAFIAQDLFSAYVESGGRKLLKKILKENPKNVLKVLQMLIDIGNADKEKNAQAQQVIVNIDMGDKK